MINITLERLLQAQVSRVYVLAKAHKSLIKAHIDALKAAGALAGMDIAVFALPQATCVGHALQDLDRKEVIRGDFLLVQPDAIGNVDIREMVRIHTERKKRDREAIMTIGMMQVAPGARNTPPSANPIVALRPRTNQLLHWHQPPVEPHTSKTSLPFEDLFTNDSADTSDIELRADLRETGIDVCGVEVPPLFSENFDYQKLRRDFVVGILTSDLLDSRLFLHIAPAAPHAISPFPQDNPSGSAWGYGSRCDSTRAYHGVALDALAGYTWPLSPGSPGWPGERLKARQACRFFGTQGVDIDASLTRIGKNTLVSSMCRIGLGSEVQESTLCAGVSVGSTSTVLSSHLYEDVKVGDGCSLTSCIIGKKATVLDGVTIERGCIVGDYCVVGPNVTLQAGTRVAISKRRRSSNDDEDDDDDSDDGKVDLNAIPALPPVAADSRLGSQSIGYLWPALGTHLDEEDGDDESESDSDSDEEEDPVEAPSNLRHLVIGGVASATAPQDVSDLSSIEGDSEFGGDDSDDDGHSVISSAASHTQSATSKFNDLTLMDDTQYETAAADERLQEFRQEASASVSRAFDEGHTIENASIELKTLRMSTNVPLSEVRKIVVEQVLSRCDATDSRKTASWLDRWSGLVSAVTTGSGEQEGKEVIDVMQSYCASHGNGSMMGLFVPLMKKFYNDDVLSDEAIIAWWKSPSSRDGGYGGVEGAGARERRVELRRRGEAVVRAVVEDSDEEDEDSEDEEESD